MVTGGGPMMVWVLLLAVLLWLGWAYLLYRLHMALEVVDPVLSAEIGRPSLFWTPFWGHRHLIGLIRRPDLGSGPHAPLAGQARLMRVWAVATLLVTAWLLWLGRDLLA